MRPQYFAFLAAAALAVACSGCMQYPGGITDITLPLGPGETYTVIGDAEGHAIGVSVLGIPMSSGCTQEALKDALEKSGGDALIQCSAEYIYIPLFFVTIMDTRVRGIAVKINKGVAVSSTGPAADAEPVLTAETANKPQVVALRPPERRNIP